MYKFSGRCDRIKSCTDASDEIGFECLDDEFTCDCIPMGTCATVDGYKNKKELMHGFLSCPEGSILFKNKTRINIHRLAEFRNAMILGFPPAIVLLVIALIFERALMVTVLSCMCFVLHTVSRSLPGSFPMF